MQYIESRNWMLREGKFANDDCRQEFNINGVTYKFPLHLRWRLRWREKSRCPLFREDQVKDVHICLSDFSYGSDYVFGKMDDLVFYERFFNGLRDDKQYTLDEVEEFLERAAHDGVFNIDTEEWEVGDD